MAYHIDEANSNVTFEVRGNKLIITAPAGSGEGGGMKTYIITSEDGTEPSDANLFSALRAIGMFLRKDVDDRSKGTIASDKQLEVGRFISGVSGAIIYVDKQTGQTIGELDKLYVRMKAYFEQLEIINVNSVGGKQIISPAGAVRCKSVLTQPDWDYYRCYFLSEQDGDKIENRFKVGDQAYCQMFNAKEGVENNISNRYYWRLVVGVGEDYIDLSKSDCDTYSDEPMPNDVICQRGNRNDINRQNFIEFSSVDSFSPSITLYQGVNNYSLTDKEVVQFGVNKVNGKSFMNVYGDMYVGNRDGSSFIQYTPENGLILKGTLDINTNFGNKTLKDTINEASNAYKEDLSSLQSSINKDIDNLQSQIDGSIETWFFDPIPTLTNPPASYWTTDEDKNKHLGDLYYSGEGRAYRFQLNSESGSYYWNEIVDTDIKKALENAKKAQDTADGKRKIFVRQPQHGESYDIGDMWVNATYPSDGSKYKEDMLRAVTANDGTQPFDIAHWQLASKYTDDTVANQALDSASKANEAVQKLEQGVKDFKDNVEGAFRDGIIDESETQALDANMKQIGALKEQVEKSYEDIATNSLLDGSTELTTLEGAKSAFLTACQELLDAVSAAIADKVITDTERIAVNAKYDNFNTKYGDYNKALNACIRYVEEKLNESISTYSYLKEALKQETTIAGGLVQTTSLVLGYRGSDGAYNVMAGSNGLVTTKGGKTTAFWMGGDMIDLFDVYNSSTGGFDREAGVRYAQGMDRMDGTGYRANGNLWWDADGRVHADPLSFFVGESKVGGLLASFQVVLKADGVHPDYLIPQVPFQSLTIADTLRIGEALVKYDATNKAVYVTHPDGSTNKIGFYAEGFVSAKGLSDSQSGGTGSASALYQLVDVVPNSTNDGVLNAANGSVLMYNGSKWQAGNVVTDISPLVLNVNGSGLFTYNGKSSITANLTVPTKVSQLTNDSGYLTAITKTQVEGVLTGNITSHTHSYLPLTGGTVTGKVIMKSSSLENLPQIYRTDGNYFAAIRFQNTLGYLGAIGINSIDGALNRIAVDNTFRPILDADNYYFYALPLSGGTITGQINKSGVSTLWINGRVGAMIRMSSVSDYSVFASIKTSNGSWDAGAHANAFYADKLVFNFISDSDYSLGNNVITAQICFRKDGYIDANLNGNAATASKWATARTLSLTGSVTGSVSIDGSDNISIATNTNHTHSYTTISTCTTLDVNSSNFSAEYAGGNNSVATKPSGVDAFGVIKLRTADGWYGQILLSANLARGLYYRTSTSLSSSVGWYKLLDSGNYNSYAPTLTGAGASGTWNINISGNAKTLANYFTSRPDTANILATANGSGGLCKFHATSSMAANKPATDGHILHLFWDNAGGFDSQLMIPVGFANYSPQWRTQNGGTWSNWISFVTSDTIGNYNAGSATKLQTARTLWGQSFNGTGNVVGSLDYVYNINMTSTEPIIKKNGENIIRVADAGLVITPYSATTSFIALRCGTKTVVTGEKELRILADGKVGIGTNSPEYKLHINSDSVGDALKLQSSAVKTCIVYQHNGSNRWSVGANTSDYFYFQNTYKGTVAYVDLYGNFLAIGAVTAKASSSDIRLKTDISDYKALSIIRGHKSIKYHWNEVAKANADIFNDDYWHYGLIAQDVQRDMPQMVSDVFKDYLVINYERLIPICWKGLQEVDDEVTKLKKKVRKLEMEIRELKQKEDRL